MELDKSEWPDGPWSNEPDRVEWRAPNGLSCLIVRGPLGALCGYVGLPPGHRFYGRADAALDVHGGLTFGALCHGAICHVAQPGEPEHVWWLGFDCAHAGDLTPGLGLFVDHDREDIYRDLNWVKAEVESLAAQLTPDG